MRRAHSDDRGANRALRALVVVPMTELVRRWRRTARRDAGKQSQGVGHPRIPSTVRLCSLCFAPSRCPGARGSLVDPSVERLVSVTLCHTAKSKGGTDGRIAHVHVDAPHVG
jgi:hypothetical protein